MSYGVHSKQDGTMDERETLQYLELRRRLRAAYLVENDPNAGLMKEVHDFLMLQRDALDAARRTTPDREAWISASERVPMPGTSEVLAWNSEGWCAVVNPEYVSPAFPEYTHWMPLPAAPGSDNGGAQFQPFSLTEDDLQEGVAFEYAHGLVAKRLRVDKGGA